MLSKEFEINIFQLLPWRWFETRHTVRIKSLYYRRSYADRHIRLSPPPRPLIFDFTMTDDPFRTIKVTPTGPDRSKVVYVRRLYTDRPDPIVFMSITVNTSVRLYIDCTTIFCVFFLNTHQLSLDASSLVRELPGILSNLISFVSHCLFDSP
jgi:hypothetical protein